MDRLDELNRQETAAIQLRFKLASRLGKMKYGEHCVIPAKQAQEAWPPTGDHDRSIEAEFRAMILRSGGHRPETSYTTGERIRNDLDESFVVGQDPINGNWLVSRTATRCPKCNGRGQVVEVALEPLPYAALEGVAPNEEYAVRTTPCDACVP